MYSVAMSPPVFSASPTALSSPISRFRIGLLSSVTAASSASSRGLCCLPKSFPSTGALVAAMERKGGVGRRSSARRVAVAEDTGPAEKVGCTTLQSTPSGDELLSRIREAAEVGRLPADIATKLEDLYWSYRSAVLQGGYPDALEIIVSNMTAVVDRVLLDAEKPFTFSPYHKAIREPFDYYMFGQTYIRPLLNFRKSYVGNVFLFTEIEEKLKQGHNVILMSNHQTEADPAIISLLLERTHPYIAEKLVFVAGDRVITDPLSKPFSMGRNLICVYSKKHLNDVPELAEMKRQANTRSLKEMALLLRSGSQIIWIAPSGGRDRPDPLTGEWYPAPFDASSVDNMRRLVERSGIPGHMFPLALLCHEIMPPPPQVEKQIGERRKISFDGVGLSVASEINFREFAACCADTDEAKQDFSDTLYSHVTKQYEVLRSAIHGGQGFSAADKDAISLCQPW